MADQNDQTRFDIAKLVVLSGWSLLLLSCVSVIGAAIVHTMTGIGIDPTLKDWATLCFGFLFGACAGMVKDFIGPRAPS